MLCRMRCSCAVLQVLLVPINSGEDRDTVLTSVTTRTPDKESLAITTFCGSKVYRVYLRRETRTAEHLLRSQRLLPRVLYIRMEEGKHDVHVTPLFRSLTLRELLDTSISGTDHSSTI